MVIAWDWGMVLAPPEQEWLHDECPQQQAPEDAEGDDPDGVEDAMRQRAAGEVAT